MKILVSQKEIELIVKRFSYEISRDYKNKELVILGLLEGALPLVHCLYFELRSRGWVAGPLKIKMIKVSSYKGTRRFLKKPYIEEINIRTKIEGKNVLIVDDILDTGHTLKTVWNLIQNCNPLSIKSCVLLDKVGCRLVDIEADYVGHRLTNKEFVVGFGLDYNGNFRNLPYIGVFNE